jgi:hypothetical protein
VGASGKENKIRKQMKIRLREDLEKFTRKLSKERTQSKLKSRKVFLIMKMTYELSFICKTKFVVFK